ncbi:MAG: amidohydrolase [Elusimicrobiota bacterium]|jgi:amidohydrolase|nr:amidohydrolase [Elusimicrobiota bacterium]
MSFESEVISIRRYVHENPELSKCEVKTSDFILQKLQQLQIPAKKIAKTGVVGLLDTGLPGKTIGLRADIDALPICEENDVPYKSKNANVMHACGHDCHVAIMLGAAQILSQNKKDLVGKVKFIFQPSEELSGGARDMIVDKVMEDPKVDVILGMHVSELIESGKVGIKFGAMMASVDRLHIKIEGKMSHGASPHAGIDPIPAAADFILAVQTIITRQIDPLQPCVITLGKISGGDNYNVVAKEVFIDGTVRTLNNGVREHIKKSIIEKLKALEISYNVKCSIEYIDNTQPLINTDEIAEFCKQTAIEFYGKDNVVMIKNPTMGGEDFSEYLKYAPGNFIYVGTNNGPDTAVHIHNSKFNVDESALPKAAEYAAFTTRKMLKEMK